MSLTSGWQTPAFWEQENDFEPIDNFGSTGTWQNVVLSRLLYLNLVRLRCIYRLTAFGIEPKRIHAVVECEEEVPRTFGDLFRLCEKGMPSTWERTKPMIAWRPIKIRLTQFGIETKSTIENMLASNDPGLSDFRKWHFICGDVVSLKYKKIDSDEVRVRVSRTVAENLVALPSVLEVSQSVHTYSEIEKVAIRQPDKMVRIFLDEEDPFDGRKFRLEDWSNNTELTKPKATAVDGKSLPVPNNEDGSPLKIPSRQSRKKGVDDILRGFLTKHHGYELGKLQSTEAATWDELKQGTDLSKSTLSKVLGRAFPKFEGTAFEKYRKACSGTGKGIAEYLVKANGDPMPSRTVGLTGDVIDGSDDAQ